MERWSPVNDLQGIVMLLAAFALSASATWLSIRYARRRNLVDHPGQRRSHTQPTPRGGGIGIVVSVLTLWSFSAVSSTSILVVGGIVVALPLLLVAGIGWIDDHRPLSVRVRLLAHFVAALMPFAFWDAYRLAMHGSHVPASMSMTQDVVLPCIWATLVVWSINLHNFMDGIDGLLSLQAVFVFAVLGALCLRNPPDAQPLFVLATATLGFVPFNFPHARTFMGDVGSGSLGLLIALAVQYAVLVGADVAPQRPVALSGVIACSAFVTDATCNLVSRMLRGRRWYSAHREHLYQWMVRSGMSHVRVVAWYMGWNLAVVAPVLWWLNREPEIGFDHGTGIFVERSELAAAAAVYTLGVALWIFGKRWCLRKVKSQARHATA